MAAMIDMGGEYIITLGHILPEISDGLGSMSCKARIKAIRFYTYL